MQRDTSRSPKGNEPLPSLRAAGIKRERHEKHNHCTVTAATKGGAKPPVGAARSRSQSRASATAGVPFKALAAPCARCCKGSVIARGPRSRRRLRFPVSCGSFCNLRDQPQARYKL